MTRVLLSDAMRMTERQQRVAEMYLRGMRQHDIAAAVGTDQSVVSRDMKAVRQYWRQSAIRDFDEATGRELEKLDLLERTYWEAWERSRTERTTQKTKKRQGKDKGYDEAALQREQRDGNPEFLRGIERCIERRCKILGLDAPEKLDVNLTPEQRRNRIVAYLASLRDGATVIEAGELPGLAGPPEGGPEGE